MPSALLLAALLVAAPAVEPGAPGQPTATPPVAPAPPTAPAAPQGQSAGTAAPAATGPARTETAPPPSDAPADPRALPAKVAAEKAVEKPAPEKPTALKTEKPAPVKTAHAEPPARAPDRPEPEPSGPRALGATTPPSLTARALLEELRRSARDRQAEQSSLGDQRRKLEELHQTVEKSRAELRGETARLQAAVATAARSPRPAAGAGGGSKKAPEDPLDALAKTTRGMKPAQAAAMMARLDRGLAAAILTRMRPADAALVLEKMEPAAGASLVALLAGKDRS